jgi:L-ascorbate metabolism protein UlaG (beta-lactamase superfamily)
MRLQRSLFPLLVLALSALPSSGQGEPVVPSPKPRVTGVDVTFLANAGFFLESGRYSVLIDAFLREPTDLFAGLPDAVYKQLVNAQAPFDELTIVLVSHDHPDHAQMRGLEKYLGKNRLAQLMTSPPVIRSLQAHARDFEALHRRITPIPTSRNSGNKIVQEEMSIEFLPLEHRGKPGEEVLNLGHLIEIGGVRVLHVGDAQPTVENFGAYDLDQRRIDVAIVPYWFFNQAKGVQVLNEEIRARTVVACHVPPSELEKFGEALKAMFPEVILFREAMEKRTFLPGGAASAESPGAGG